MDDDAVTAWPQVVTVSGRGPTAAIEAAHGDGIAGGIGEHDGQGVGGGGVEPGQEQARRRAEAGRLLQPG